MTWIIERLQEPSTWRGFTMLATAAGITISPELMPHIVAVGTAVAGLLGVITKDKQ